MRNRNWVAVVAGIFVATPPAGATVPDLCGPLRHFERTHRLYFGLLLLLGLLLLPAHGSAQTIENETWPAAPASSGDFDLSRLSGLAHDIRDGKFHKIGAVLVARHGRPVYEEYFDGDADTLRDTRSATKSITGILVGIAVDEHVLRGVQDKVLDLLPEHRRKILKPDPRKANITVEDFLTMSSSLECDDWNDASRGNEERMYLVEDWAQFILDLPIRGRMHLGENPAAPPFGRYFSYCTGGVFVLSEVLQHVTHQRTDRFASQKLFAPLGIRDAEWVYSPMNIPQTGGGLRLTARDLLKIAQLYLNGGSWNRQQVVSESWVRTSTQPHVQVDDATNYGYLWWLKSFGAPGHMQAAYFMSGNGGNKVAVFPDLDMVAVVTSTNYNTHGMHEQTERILNEYVVPAAAP
jgi:CubicO group peptidase (beta-lactamase class C family)